jgi:hypothetical protein
MDISRDGADALLFSVVGVNLTPFATSVRDEETFSEFVGLTDVKDTALEILSFGGSTACLVPFTATNKSISQMYCRINQCTIKWKHIKKKVHTESKGSLVKPGVKGGVAM